ncbi:hypothetical protein SFRURICE_007086, partial [Spodoptera frugiperda]
CDSHSNTNQTTPIKLIAIESATNGCASRNKIGALGEVRFKTVALRGISLYNTTTQLIWDSNLIT